MVFLLVKLCLSPSVVVDVVLQVVCSIVLDVLAQQWLML